MFLKIGMEGGDNSHDSSAPDLVAHPQAPPRKHRRRHTPPRPPSNGLPPTPKVHMGACFSKVTVQNNVRSFCYTFSIQSKVFNGCPLRIHCTASWIHPETRDQHILIGADEGVYNLNLNELHDACIDQLYPRRTVWMYVIKDVLMTLSGNCVGRIFVFIAAR